MTENEFLSTKFPMYPYTTNNLLIGLIPPSDDEEYDEEYESKAKKAVLERLSPVVKDFFLQNPERYMYLYQNFIEEVEEDPDSVYPPDLELNHSVYEVYLKDTNQVFYVGISLDDKDYQPPKQTSPVKFICDHRNWGYRRLIRGLDKFNAEVYADGKIVEYIKSGGYIISYHMTELESDNVWKMQLEAKTNKKSLIYKSNYMKEYFPDFYNRNDSFDKVTSEGLSVVFFNGRPDDNYIKAVQAAGYTVLKTLGKTVKSVIVDGFISYEKYDDYRTKGMNIYAIEDVLGFLGIN